MGKLKNLISQTSDAADRIGIVEEYLKSDQAAMGVHTILVIQNSIAEVGKINADMHNEAKKVMNDVDELFSKIIMKLSELKKMFPNENQSKSQMNKAKKENEIMMKATQDNIKN